MKSIRADEVSQATLETLSKEFLDITGAQHIEIRMDVANHVVWVNVNGICVLRVCRIVEMEVVKV